MAVAGDKLQQYVLRPEVASKCIDALWERDTHSHFPAYLHLRRLAGLNGSNSDLVPDWSALSELLQVPGGPTGRPHLRPFWNGKRTSNQEWLGPNLSGSYSPSSLRATMLLVVEIDANKHYALRDHHWELARTHLLFDKPMEVLNLAGFLFRDFSLTALEPPSTDDLIAAFRWYFGYSPSDDEEFAHLYTSEKTVSEHEWFTIFDQP